MASNDDNKQGGDKEAKQGAAKTDNKAAGQAVQPAQPVPSAAADASNAARGSEDAVDLLKADHRKVEALFAEFEGADDARKREIVREACGELIAHTILEEEIFYPACRQALDEDDPIDEAQVEHDSAKLLIRELLDGDDADPYRDARFKVLAEQIKHHVAEEEEPTDGVFAQAKTAGVDTQDLGRRIKARKAELQPRMDALRPTRLVSFETIDTDPNPQQEEYDMARNNGPDRDDRGRFTSDDDDRGGRGGNGGGRGGGQGQGGWFGDSRGHSEASRRGWDERRSFSGRGSDSDDRGGRGGGGRDYDDDRGGRGGGQGGWFGDSRGHSEAARRGWEERGDGGRGGYSSRGRDDDDDRGGRGGGRGQGGWFGDPEGHSEASRRGWEERGDGGRGGYSSRGRDDDDDRGGRGRGGGGGRGQGGWFGDPEGHSEASRRGWEERDDGGRGGSSSRGRDDDDRGGRGGGQGQGGWFGDSRGHAEAARRGWEERDGGGRGGSSSRGRDDDDRGGRGGGGRGRNQGGWFGDPEGHSEAARRGWEDRR